MHNLEKIEKLYKLEYDEQKTIEMIGIPKSKAIAYAFIINDSAIDYIEFMTENGEPFKTQVNISNLPLIGITDEETKKAFINSITEQLGYTECNSSEIMAIGKKIEKFVSQLGS